METDYQIARHRIIVIQSLCTPYKETGYELFHDILQYKNFYRNDSFAEFYSVNSRNDFLQKINEILNSVNKGETITLHFETHGEEKGVGLNSKEIVSWEDCDNAVRPINEKISNLLIVVMAMCKGGALLSHIDPERRCPYLAFVGSFKNVLEDEVRESFTAFYSDYFSPLDIHKSMIALNRYYTSAHKKSPFGCFSAEFIFDKTFDTDRDSKYFHSLIELNCFRKYGDCSNEHLEIVKKEVKGLFDFAKQKRDYFLFRDVYKE